MMIVRFVSSIFTRFAKTFGVISIIAGFALAAYFAYEVAPLLENVRYHPSTMLAERASALTLEYNRAKEILLKFRVQTEFPQPYAAANVEPQFRPTYADRSDFAELRRSLADVDAGRAAMKRYVTDTVDSLISDIQEELLAHAKSLHAESAPKTTPTPTPSTPAPAPLPTLNVETLYQSNLQGDAQKETLEREKDYLDTLRESAEIPENRKKLEASMAEIALLEKLLPVPVVAAPSTVPAATPTPAPEPEQTPEPLPAEKVAAHLGDMRGNIKEAVLDQWALDAAYDSTVSALDNEERYYTTAQIVTHRIYSELFLRMAEVITAGLALGLFFFLIGDWTKKAGTEVLDHWCELIENLNVSPKEVYQQVEAAVKAREMPGLEASREFWHEGGAISAKREYLRFARERLVFEICAAPFGTGSFLSFRSSIVPLVIDPLGIFTVFGALAILLAIMVGLFGLLWGGIILVLGFVLLIFALRAVIARSLADLDRTLMKMPLFGSLYEIFLRPVTYYRIDAMIIYMKAVKQTVAELFNSMFGEKGMPLMPKVVDKPILDRMYRR